MDLESQGFGLSRFLAAKKAVQEGDQRDQFLQDRAALGPNPTPESLMNLGVKNSDPKTLLDLAFKMNPTLGNSLPNIGSFTPDQLDQLGQRLALQGHPGAATVMNIADKRRKAQEDKTALTGMQSTPEGSPVTEDGPQIHAPGKPGVVPDYLTSDPMFGSSAKALQKRIDSGFLSPTASEGELSRLTTSYNAAQQAKALVAARGEQARQTKTTAPAFNADGVISDDARKAAAARYNLDGTLPANLGRGNQGAVNTVSILNEAADAQKAAGNAPEEQRVRQIANKASTLALNALSKDLTAIEPFNAMLHKNADIAIDLAKKISSSRTGSQFVNRPLTWLQNNAADNPDIAEYLFQMQTVKTEGARVLNNPRLVGQLTDSARHEMGDIVNGSMPLGQTVRVLTRMKSDGDNRVNAIKSQRQALLGSMRSAPEAPSNGPPPPAGFTPL